MTLKTAFHWEPNTRILRASSQEPPSPEEEGVYYPPGPWATFEVPPELQAGQAARRLADNSGWEVVPDRRGQVYWLADGSRHEITEASVEPPAGALSEEPPAPTPAADVLLARFERAIDRRLLDLVRSWGYDSVVSCISYLDDPNEVFDAEARAVRDWRSAVWTDARQLLADVKAGNSQAPQSEAELFTLLPAAPARPQV